MRMETYGGQHIRDCVAAAVEMAAANGQQVTFAFNDKDYTVEPSDSYETARVRAEVILGHPIRTADEEHAELKRDMEAREAAEASAIAGAGVPTEKELREADVPWLKTSDELAAYIKALVDRPHDYGTCVYAMSMAAVAAFHHVASVLGVTGLQASCADMDILRRTRRLDGPFMFIKAEDALYPQYDIEGNVREFIEKQADWLAEEARKKLADTSNVRAHPNVVAHWERLAGARA